MSNIVQKVKTAYRHSYPEALEGNEKLKKAFWNGYMCRVVDEEMMALRAIGEAEQYTDDEVAEKMRYD